MTLHGLLSLHSPSLITSLNRCRPPPLTLYGRLLLRFGYPTVCTFIGCVYFFPIILFSLDFPRLDLSRPSARSCSVRRAPLRNIGSADIPCLTRSIPITSIIIRLLLEVKSVESQSLLGRKTAMEPGRNKNVDCSHVTPRGDLPGSCYHELETGNSPSKNTG